MEGLRGVCADDFSFGAFCKHNSSRLGICSVWLAGLSLLLFARLSGASDAPARVFPEAAQDGETALPLAKSLVRASRRSLAEGGGYLQACGNPSYTSEGRAADAASDANPGMEERLRALLITQEKVFAIGWRTITKMLCLDGLRTMGVLVAFATIEQVTLSAFLSPELEERRRSSAVQLLSLARFLVRGTPHMMPFSRQVYRLLRACKLYSFSRIRRAELPVMTPDERTCMLEELVMVQNAAWSLVHGALLELDRWSPADAGMPLELLSKRVLLTIAATLRTRRRQLLRIPAAVYCLSELQAAAKLKLIFGQAGVETAKKYGPLPGAEGQILQLMTQVEEVQRTQLLAKYSEGEEELTLGEFSATEEYTPSNFEDSEMLEEASSYEFTPSVKTTFSTSRQALHMPEHTPNYPPFYALFSSNPPALPLPLPRPRPGVGREERHTHSSSPSVRIPSPEIVYPEDHSVWRNEGSTSITLPATEGAVEAPIQDADELGLQRDFAALRFLWEAKGDILSSGIHLNLDRGNGVQLPHESDSQTPFYGVPLGDPAQPWPPEVLRPAGTTTPFDLVELDFWSTGLSFLRSGGHQRDNAQTRP
ncbi:hypothetical protein, conserved [Eimeria acervulina]|uniref:Uncharacterized protein n=1 Tax=Eimeria acervulina TaxID=5801 RepID=U6GBM8_EIMAC|nr:hypothetical protein, conserved [Eimeria acervulina]CDI77515.1 hypothetical protein, conserved [Eimeria acervulina]